VIWGERRKAEAAKSTPIAGNGFNGGNGSGYSVDEIEQIVREGAPVGENRSDTFHTIIGHYIGVGWETEQIFAHLQQFPNGIGGRYLSEGRLSGEIARSAAKYAAGMLPQSDANGWVNGFETKAPTPSEPDSLDDPELDDVGEDAPVQHPAPDPELDDDDLGEAAQPAAADPELDDELDDLSEDGSPTQDPNLPPLYAHGDPDPRPLKSWLVKYVIPERGHGLLSGQWGTAKTFVLLELSAALMTGQPFVGYIIKRQCGVLLIAAEGADEVRLRLDAVVREKCGGMERAPFRWYETAPMLLQKGSAKKLIAMARQAEASLQQEFGLPLGLIIIDTLGACAGYTRAGEESDPSTGQAMMDVLKALSQAIGCFVLGTAHFGKDQVKGTRGGSSREDAGDVVLVCLGARSISGAVTNTRLAVRKNKGGRQGMEFPFSLRKVEAPELDEDGEAISTMVVDWLPAGATVGGGTPGGAGRPPHDPWAETKRLDQRAAMLRLKRVLMEILADQGVDLPIPPDGPAVRMVSQDAARAAFYVCTPATEGTPKQQRDRRRAQFNSALERAEEAQLIGIKEIEGVTYLWLSRPLSEPASEDGEEGED
jgi:AAA domain